MNRINLRLFFVFAVLSVLVIFLDQQGILKPVRDGAEFVVAPVLSVTSSTKRALGDTFSFLTFWKSGEERIKNLEQRNLVLSAKLVNVHNLQQENAQLRKQLGVGALSKYRQLPAEVLGVGRYMIINTGWADGVRPGMTVVYTDNYVGQVLRSDAHVSFVKMATDADSQIPVKDGADSTIRGVVNGQFNSALVVDQIAQNENLNPGDIILTSGDEGKVAADLSVGVVSRIKSLPTDVFKRAEVRPNINYSKLTTVFVLLP